jgi:hypothetical protein
MTLNLRFLFFCIIRETYTRAKETGKLLYFTVLKFKILRVTEFFTAFVPSVIEYKYIVPVNDKLFNIKTFDVGGIWPASYLILLKIDMIINRAGESKPVSKKGLQHVPIFLLISSVDTSNDFFVGCLVVLVGKAGAKQNNSDCEYVPDRFFFESIFHVIQFYLLYGLISRYKYKPQNNYLNE